MIGRRAEVILNRAVRYAIDQQHEYFTLEHVLLSLLFDPKIHEAVSACGGNLKNMKSALESYLEAEIPKAARLDPPPQIPKNGELSEKEAREGSLEHPVATLSIQRLIQRALFHVQSAGKDEIQPEDLLVALFQAKDSKALWLLSSQGIERLDVLNYMSHGVHKGDHKNGHKAEHSSDSTHSSPQHPSEDEEDMDDLGEDEGGGGGGYLGSKRHSDRAEGTAEHESAAGSGAATGGTNSSGHSSSDAVLQLYTICVNDLARQGKIDPLIGREKELNRILQILCRRRKNNPLLVGESGVGKTALAEGLALHVVEKKIPKLLENVEIYSLDLGSLLAGAKFRGDFEQRLKRVLQALERRKERGAQPVLFIDEIHTIIGAGAVSGGALDAAHLLKPLLAQGGLRCIGSTTYMEYRNIFEKDAALSRRFQKIDIPEPTKEESIKILEALKSRFEEYHQVHYLPDTIRTLVDLSVKHLTDRFLPDKAIDVLDELGARLRLQQAQAQQISPEASAVALLPPSKPSVDIQAVEEVIAQMARIPARSVNTQQKTRLRNLKEDLKISIFGQDHAVEALVTAIRLSRSGLRTGDRPIGSFLFCGPTGVGKTELSKQLGHCLGVPFLRFDMSEYSEKHTVSRLIGAPPGYVGFDQAGLLTESVLKSPYAVVLLDEIEKAHSDIWNVLLQVMDHGALTDQNGRKADFRNTVLILTSNVGSRELERRSLGMHTEDSSQRHSSQKAVEQTFSPEFRNRLDAVIYFNPLDQNHILQVVGKQLIELEDLLLAKNVDVEFSSDLKEWLTQRGYDRLMGARPLGRLIQDRIKRPLSEEILFGKLEEGGKVKVLIQNDEPYFEFSLKNSSEKLSHSGKTKKSVAVVE